MNSFILKPKNPDTFFKILKVTFQELQKLFKNKFQGLNKRKKNLA